MPTDSGLIPVYYGPGTPIVNANGSPVIDALEYLTFQADPVIDCATQARIDAQFVRARKYCMLYQNIKQACYNMLDGNINDAFKFSSDPNLTGWNPLMEIETILDQLVTT